MFFMILPIAYANCFLLNIAVHLEYRNTSFNIEMYFWKVVYMCIFLLNHILSFTYIVILEKLYFHVRLKLPSVY